jgi:hypothetical protein
LTEKRQKAAAEKKHHGYFVESKALGTRVNKHKQINY